MAEENEWQSSTIKFITMPEVETKIAEEIAALGGGGGVVGNIDGGNANSVYGGQTIIDGGYA